LLLSRVINSPRRYYVNKDGEGWMNFPHNLTLTCYYFETFVIVTWCKQSHNMLCKQRWRMGEWHFLKLTFDFLLFWNVIVTWCKQTQAMLIKQWGRQCDAVLNFNLLFWNVIVTWCKNPQAMLCKQWVRQCDAVLNFNLLW
jgi:hypothetical protein